MILPPKAQRPFFQDYGQAAFWAWLSITEALQSKPAIAGVPAVAPIPGRPAVGNTPAVPPVPGRAAIPPVAAKPGYPAYINFFVLTLANGTATITGRVPFVSTAEPYTAVNISQFVQPIGVDTPAPLQYSPSGNNYAIADEPSSVITLEQFLMWTLSQTPGANITVVPSTTPRMLSFSAPLPASVAGGTGLLIPPIIPSASNSSSSGNTSSGSTSSGSSAVTPPIQILSWWLPIANGATTAQFFLIPAQGIPESTLLKAAIGVNGSGAMELNGYNGGGDINFSGSRMSHHSEIQVADFTPSDTESGAGMLIPNGSPTMKGVYAYFEDLNISSSPNGGGLTLTLWLQPLPGSTAPPPPPSA